jgi:hypothetical protein
MLNNPAEYERDISNAKSIISFAHILLICYCRVLLVGLPESSDGQLGNFPLSHVIPPLFSMLISHLGMKNMSVGGRSSET